MKVMELRVRKTQKYRDGWSFLDEWEDIGSYHIKAESPKIFDEEDHEDSFHQNLFVRVSSDASHSDIQRALEQELSGSSCQHEWDCCGCYSYYATARWLSDDLWLVLYSGSRNY